VNPTSHQGLFITLEGIDGAGKTTQFDTVVAALRAAGRRVTATREPGGTPLGERIRELLLGEPMTTTAEALLMFAARQEHVLRIIEPALLQGHDVVCDRFTDATLAYQGAGKGIPQDRLQTLARWVHPGLKPDFTLLIDVPAELAAKRLQTQQRQPDRFERESLEFFVRVRQHYLQLAADEPRRWVLIDGTQSLEQVRAEVIQSVKKRIQAND
jgi:thymidylate kinase (EC 2.7.4.9)